MEERVSSFSPVVAPSASVLILGTMPSVASLGDGFYYAHPRNAFWPILAAVYDDVRPRTTEEKRALILRRGLAVWDVLSSCVRPGSLDSAIRDGLPNDILPLLARERTIERILFNGQAANALFLRLLGKPPIEAVVLPSTSPANTMKLEKKKAAWSNALLGR